MTRKTRWSMALLALLTAGPAPAQEETPMPLTIHERLWESPGPAQDGPGAPRLLIVYPEANAEPIRESTTRYAGRVEPTTATVRLGGKSLKVWPGGVFTGTRPMGVGETQIWRFVAEAGGKRTTVERKVTREAPAPPAPRRPLAFYATPVSPTGDWWLPESEKLRVTLWASENAVAEARVGEAGKWQTMEPAGLDPDRGARYTTELEPRLADGQPRALTVEFRLRAPKAEGSEDAEFLPSQLRLGRMPTEPPLGRIAKNRGTFLKRSDPEDWQRWSNWIEHTPFPVLEVRGERMRADFGRGESGWIETENAKIAFDQPYGKPPRLDAPTIDPDPARLILRWPNRASPVAAVFTHRPDPSGDRLRIDLPGADALPDKTYNLSGERPMRSLATHDGEGPRGAPWIDVALTGPLWGFDMREGPLAIEVRTPPRRKQATAERPLTGLRVMLDAGHGGKDPGALGPSGLTEADLNLVQAAWLEKYLAEMGAQMRQMRRGDEYIELDRRVDLALAWDPDLFISLHHNSVGMTADPMSDSGPTVFYHYATGEPLARAIAERIAGQWPETAPRALPQNFRVNRNVSLCPSVLVETAFVCNPKDELRLRRAETLKKDARAIAEAVRDYLSR